MKKIITFVCAILVLTTMFISTSYAIDEINDEEMTDISLIDEYRYEVSSFSADRNSMMRSLTCDYVDTPNGTDILIYLLMCNHTENYIEIQNTRWDAFFPEAHRWSSADCTYNCHSFAWYSQDTEFNCSWMDDPSSYYNDRSYIEVSIPRKGDIICYFDDNDTNSKSDDSNLHSGIVLEYDSSISSNNVCGIANQVLVLSKWGQVGLYEHQGDYCPYTSNYGGDADYVKFYRPRTNMEIDLNANMSLRNSSISLSNTGEITDRYYMYELNVEASGMYDIYVNPNISLNERFYDENMNLLSYSAYYPNSTFAHHYYANLAQGRYYFRVENVNASESTDARITFISHDFHNYQYTNINDNNHTASCTCGHTEISDHAYEYKQISDFYHILKCDCGATSGIQEGHIYTGSGLIGYVKCIQCGFLKYVGNTTIPIIKGKIPTIEAICKE